MKCRIVALFLAMLLVSLFVMNTSLALAETMSNVQSINSSWSSPFNHNEWKPFYSFNLNSPARVTATIVTPDGNKFNNARVGSSLAQNLQCGTGEVVLSWSAVNEKGWHAGAGSEVNYQVIITAETDDGTSQTVTVPYTFHYAHDITEHQNQPEPTYYPNNTACSFGPHFRNVSPALTQKWYTFTPLDLTRQGVQVYELVAGNVNVVGQVYVHVQGDMLMVTYKLFDRDMEVRNEFFTFFHDYNDIVDVTPEYLPRLEYGRTYSISEDFDGDTTMILFVCNRMDYDDSMHGVYRMYENMAYYSNLRQEMLRMIGRPGN